MRSVLQVPGADGRPRNLQQGDRVRKGTVLARVDPAGYQEKVDQARAQLAEGNLNTAKYAMASFYDKTLFDRHARALTNLEVAALAQDLDVLLFQPGLLGEHEIVKEPPVNRKMPLLSLMRLLGDNLLAEVLLTTTFIATGTLLVFLLAQRLTTSLPQYS